MSKRKKHTFTLSEAAKKKLVLNLPYCMIGLYATKLGQAWRMAEGTNLSEKLLRCLTYLSPNEHEAADLTGVPIRREGKNVNWQDVEAAAVDLLAEPRELLDAREGRV